MDIPPADSPNIVTRAASPPNAPALSRTQRSANAWSCVPRFPVLFAPLSAASSGSARNPNMPSRYCTVTTATPRRARPEPSNAPASYPSPAVNPPPWIHTITGSGPEAFTGAYTLCGARARAPPSV